MQDMLDIAWIILAPILIIVLAVAPYRLRDACRPQSLITRSLMWGALLGVPCSIVAEKYLRVPQLRLWGLPQLLLLVFIWSRIFVVCAEVVAERSSRDRG